MKKSMIRTLAFVLACISALCLMGCGAAATDNNAAHDDRPDPAVSTVPNESGSVNSSSGNVTGTGSVNSSYDNVTGTGNVTGTNNQNTAPAVNQGIIAQPQNVDAIRGQNVTISVAAVGNVTDYCWQYCPSGTDWRNVNLKSFPSGATDALSFVAHLSENGFKYRCVITYADGSNEISSTVTLTVTDASETEASVNVSTNTEQSDTIFAIRGQNVEIKVTPTSRVQSYCWQYCTSGADWKNVNQKNFPSATTDTLTFVAQTNQDGFKYRCIIAYANGNNEISKTITLNVKDASDTET